MYNSEDQVQDPEVVSPNDPDVSFKHIGLLAGFIIVPLLLIAIVIPFIPSQKKPSYKLNTNTSVLLPSPAPETFIATAILASVTGDVSVQKNQIWLPAKQDDNISQGDVLKTSDNSSATILFGSGSLMRVDANSQIALSNYSKDGDTWIIKINQIIGRTWNRVQKLIGASVYEVDTPSAVATVRGTAFGIDANATASAVTVDEGTVSAKLVDTKSPDRKIISEVQINKQEQIEITQQKVEEVKKALEERRSIAKIVEARKSEKLPEWIEEHKREVERIAPKIEKLRIDMKEKIEKKEIEIKKEFEIKRREIERETIKDASEAAREQLKKYQEKVELRPTPTPSATPLIQRTISYPTPTPYTKVEESRPSPTSTSTSTIKTNIDSDVISRSQ